MPRTAIPPTTPPAMAPAFFFFPEPWLPIEELPGVTVVAEGTLTDSVPPEEERELSFRALKNKINIPAACAEEASKPFTICLIRLCNRRNRREGAFVQ